jgi:hypothetical protein
VPLYPFDEVRILLKTGCSSVGVSCWRSSIRGHVLHFIGEPPGGRGGLGAGMGSR